MATIFGDATFESGTVGATLTTANSPFTLLVQPGWTYVNTPLLPTGGGTRAAQSAATTGTASAMAAFSVTSTPVIYLRFYLYVSTFPAANTALAQVLGSSVIRGELQLGPAGQFRMRNAALSTIATSPNGSAPTGGWCRVEWRFDNTALRQQLRIYNGANLHTETPTWDSGAIAVAASGPVTSVDLGAIANTAVMTTVWDNVKADDATWVGSAVFVPTDPPPVAVAGPDVTGDPNIADTFVLDGTGSTGTITSSAWDDMTSGTAVPVAGTGLTRTIAIPKNTTDTTRTYRLTVTGSGGSTTDTLTATIKHYRWWRKDGSGLTPRKRQPAASDTTPPTVPGTPVAIAGTGSTTVTTSGSTDAYGVSAYEWQRNGTVTETTPGTTLTEVGLPAGTPVSYRVRARDVAGNWSALSAVSNTVTPLAGGTVQTLYGAAPRTGTPDSSVVTKYGTGASVRLFNSGGFGAAEVRPTGASVVHVSWKPALGGTITAQQVITATANLRDGDMVEAWHESDVKYRGGSDLAAMLNQKNQLHALVVSLRNAGTIPHLLTVNTWAGWSVDSTSSVNPANLHCNADLLGIDWDGIPAQPDFYPFVTRQMGTKFRNAYAAGGYTGWTIPEFAMPWVSTDPDRTARIAWFQGQMAGASAGVPSAGIPPALAVMWFDMDGSSIPNTGLDAANEIAAWRALVASNT